MDRLFNFDVRSLVELLVCALPRLMAVRGLWRSGGRRNAWRCGLGGVVLVMDALLMCRTLQRASSRTIGRWQVLRGGGTVTGMVLGPYVRWGPAGSRWFRVGGKRVIATGLRGRVAWPRARRLQRDRCLGLGRGEFGFD